MLCAGCIPKEMGNLTEIKFFWLCSKQLTGKTRAPAFCSRNVKRIAPLVSKKLLTHGIGRADAMEVAGVKIKQNCIALIRELVAKQYKLRQLGEGSRLVGYRSCTKQRCSTNEKKSAVQLGSSLCTPCCTHFRVGRTSVIGASTRNILVPFLASS